MRELSQVIRERHTGPILLTRPHTPLTRAAEPGDTTRIRSLLNSGSDPDLPGGGSNGWTPLLHAVHRGQLSSLPLGFQRG